MLTVTKDRDTGLLIAEILPENKVLSGFLETEIQQDLGLLHLIQQRISDTDALPNEINGNAHSLSLTKGKYIISALFDSGQSCKGPLQELTYVLDQWEAYLVSK